MLLLLGGVGSSRVTAQGHRRNGAEVTEPYGMSPVSVDVHPPDRQVKSLGDLDRALHLRSGGLPPDHHLWAGPQLKPQVKGLKLFG